MNEIEKGKCYSVVAVKADTTIGTWVVVVDDIKTTKNGRTLIVGKKADDTFCSFYSDRIVSCVECF